MPRWSHILFGLVWLAMAAVFAWLAEDAHRFATIKLARYEFRIPREMQVQIGNVRFQDVINGIAEVQEQNTTLLENSLHRSYTTVQWLNIFSCALSLVGFCAQIGEHLHESRQRHKSGGQQEAAPEPKAAPIEEVELTQDAIQKDKHEADASKGMG
jgi:hypothetical protein